MIEVQALMFKEMKDLEWWCMEKGMGFEIEVEGKEVVRDGKWVAFMIREVVRKGVK